MPQITKDIIDRTKANVERVEDAGLSTMLISTYLLKDLLDIAEASQQIADGTYVAMPIEPTEAMLVDGEFCITSMTVQGRSMRKAYDAMIAADK